MQDADMAENINFNMYIVQNIIQFGAVIVRMKQIPGTVAIFWRNFWYRILYGILFRAI